MTLRAMQKTVLLHKLCKNTNRVKILTGNALGYEAVMLSSLIPVEAITGFVDGVFSVQDLRRISLQLFGWM